MCARDLKGLQGPDGVGGTSIMNARSKPCRPAGRVFMSIGAEVAAHLPFLRRYARALTGSQSTGDAFVQATLEAALADAELADTLRGGRVPLYRAFNKVWSSAYLEVADEQETQGLHESAAQDQLRRITPVNRQALLLTTVEDFSPRETAEIMDMSEGDVTQLVTEAV